ncbi:MAG: hypothetical protein ACI8QS_003064 [Planctomycetota bacterium]
MIGLFGHELAKIPNGSSWFELGNDPNRMPQFFAPTKRVITDSYLYSVCKILNTAAQPIDLNRFVQEPYEAPQIIQAIETVRVIETEPMSKGAGKSKAEAAVIGTGHEHPRSGAMGG